MGFNGVVSMFSSPGFWKTGTKKGYPTAPFCIHWESDKGPQGLGFCVRVLISISAIRFRASAGGRRVVRTWWFRCPLLTLHLPVETCSPTPARDGAKVSHCLVANGFKSYFSCSCFLQLLCARCAVTLCGSFTGPKVGVLVQQGQQLSMLLILERVWLDGQIDRWKMISVLSSFFAKMDYEQHSH